MFVYSTMKVLALMSEGRSKKKTWLILRIAEIFFAENSDMKNQIQNIRGA